MVDTTDQRIARLRERLTESREQLFDLAEAMKSGDPAHLQLDGQPADSGFPHSRLMRALMGQRAALAIGTAAVAATVLRPRLLWSALRLTPMLRPIFMRYVLPRLLGQR